MKLIRHSVGVLMVSGAIYLASAPFFPLMQPVAASSFVGFDVAFTPEQAERPNQLDAQTRSRLQTMLTPTQLTQLEAALDRESGISQTALTALNLSLAQQAELMQILSTQQATDVLTPNQIEQVRQNLPFHP